MKIEMGESLFYSWLRHVKACQVVQTNWKVSPQWELKHEDELQALMELTDRHFTEKYGYRIYKKNSSLAQIIRQGECDAIGICIQEGLPSVYAVDVAFHEGGLSYGSRQETVMKIVAKSLRTAMCLYGFLDTKTAEIVFASPKINPAVLNDAIPCVEDANTLLAQQGFRFSIRIIANSDFNDLVLQPILFASEGVADTSELFLRGYQMFKMFNNSDSRKTESTGTTATSGIQEMKIGAIAKSVLRRLLESGAATETDVSMFLTKGGSQEAFSLTCPLLVELDSDYPNTRYYADSLTIRGKQYRMTSQWYEAQRKPLLAWIEKHANDGSCRSEDC
jgi:hypothetical protein